MEKNDFQITNDLLDKIVGGKKSCKFICRRICGWSRV